MLAEELSELVVIQKAISSQHLNRYVIVDIYIPKNITDVTQLSLLLINDGQDLEDMPFSKILNQLYTANEIEPILCVGIHANKYRKNEYGIAAHSDYAGRGNKATGFTNFILHELLPYIRHEFGINNFKSRGYAGFSLGGLSALDIVWNHPDVFSFAGVFSGSLWWRSRDLHDDYNDDMHRIMHQQIRKSTFKAGLKFYFTTGSKDETADRNNNGIIDAIDDTLDLIKELEHHGYKQDNDIQYINYEDGKHDVATWGIAMPEFLKWGWGRSAKLEVGSEKMELNS